ncbi:putative outer membrane protein [Pedobacter sp. BAL39]|uniref:SusC/RagA family TonB-linked outer membrane protein n=1 Tax=Pedobacter sp. BAL39 TaxID=391596 RepID=UPI0001559B0E|nr:TonB-dependent receptor [Pedobacter sp. BAL39]EDM36269.1 putative outer membrane protein [Pedobacter sp. BAL39]
MKKLLLFTFFLLFCAELIAQNITVTGKVSDNKGGVLPGVSIKIKGTSVGTTTNNAGEYVIRGASPNQILSFSYLGFQVKEVAVKEGALNVILESSSEKLDEVVVIGYGTQKKKEVTGAVGRVTNSVLSQSATADLGTALQGQVPGVTVQASSGRPGAVSNIQIRGLSSVTGRNEPLFVVDGIPYNADPQLSVNEIESVDILKDAASAAIYGTRGAGGVILITTKKGKSGKMKVDVDSYVGTQKITSGIPVMNFDESIYAMFINAYHFNGTPIGDTWTPLEENRYYFTNNTKMSDVIERDNSPMQNHSLSVSGGKQDLTYNVSANYIKQSGMIINSGFDRFNVRANTSIREGKWNINTGIGLRLDKQEYEPWQILLDAYKYQPYQPLIDPDQEEVSNGGIPGSNETINLSYLSSQLKTKDKRNGNHTNFNLQVDYDLVESVKLTTRFGGSYTDNTRIRVNPLFKAYDNLGNLIPMAQRSGVYNSSDKSSSLAWENSANYSKRFGDHQLKVLGLFSVERYQYTSFFAQKFDLINNNVVVLNGATADPNAGSGTDWDQDRTNSLIGMLARVQYDYKGRYLLSVSARRDGSSRFSKDYRWGTFPSVSAGWNVSDEQFWKPVANVINTLKIRASYGTTGNQNFQDYSNAAAITIGKDYVFGPETSDHLTLGAIQTAFANKNVKWETTAQSNVGFDLTFLNNKLTFTGDLYNTDKRDMLFPLLVPSSTGTGQNSTVILNVGNMNNKGVELAANYAHDGTFSWKFGVNFARNVNKITKMSGANKIAYMNGGTAVDGISNPDRLTVIKEGYEAGAFFLMPTNGVIKTEEQLLTYKKLVPTAKLGDLQYIDSNNDNKLTDDDRVYYGSGAPEYVIGSNISCAYKGFDLAMQWYGSFGNEVVNSSRIYAYLGGTHRDLVYQWSPRNPDSNIPANRGGSHDNYRGYSDYWIENGSYIRLRNISLGYKFSPKLIRFASNLRVYVAAQNPITITKYKGFDPEVGNDGLESRGIDKGNYPIGAIYRAGVQVNF